MMSRNRSDTQRMISSASTFYYWKKKYGGMGVSELGRLKQPEEENSRLKKLVADLALDKHILQRRCSQKKSEAHASPRVGGVDSRRF